MTDVPREQRRCHLFGDEAGKKQYTVSMKFFFVLYLAVCSLAFGVWRVQAMSSTNYQIPWDSVNSSGNELGASTNYTLYDTSGQVVSGASTSTSFQVNAGYRAGLNPLSLSFIAEGQSSSVVTRYGIFEDDASTYVVVSSTVGFVVGDYVAAVQDVGFGGLVAVGKIIGVSADILTVDRWDGDGGLMALFSSGSDDYVYKLDADTIPFASMSAGAERVALVGGSVYSSASSGHTVYVEANGGLALDGVGTTITDVADATVSVDAEEYGAEVIGPHAVILGSDLPVTSTQTAIVSTSVPSVSTPDRFSLLFKLSVLPSTPVGSYSQQVYFTLTSNF